MNVLSYYTCYVYSDNGGFDQCLYKHEMCQYDLNYFNSSYVIEMWWISTNTDSMALNLATITT